MSIENHNSGDFLTELLLCQVLGFTMVIYVAIFNVFDIG